jgi:N-acetylmuramoyl-L-alanine amidase
VKLPLANLDATCHAHRGWDQMLKTFSYFCLLAMISATAVVSTARAQEDLSDAESSGQSAELPRVNFLQFMGLSPQEIFARTEAVLANFGVPAENDSQPLLVNFENLQTNDGLKSLLPYFDPKNGLSKFTQLTSSELNAYQDVSGFQTKDFTASLRADSDTAPPSTLIARLRAAQNNPDDLPLQGLRIALDPGHMGTDNWDLLTGKWVRDAATGRKVSEGVINLQTALLLEAQLTKLGAQVMVTRHELAPVTTQDYASFDVHAWGLRLFREHSLYTWFQGLLAQAPVGNALFNAFSASKDFQALLAEKNRATYFNDSDLQARVDVIAAFQPDITMMIHYDTSAPAADPHGTDPGPAGHRDGTKVYVPGAFDPSEMASREDRVELAEMMLDDAPWKASRSFAHEVVTTMSANLKLPLEHGSPGMTTTVEPGVFTRNLYLLKKYRNSAVAYVECLFYNDRGEFNTFANGNHPMMIGGENRPYSDRQQQVADSLRQAIVQFVKKGP